MKFKDLKTIMDFKNNLKHMDTEISKFKVQGSLDFIDIEINSKREINILKIHKDIPNPVDFI